MTDIAGAIERVKIETREHQCPYFEDEDIEYYLQKNSYDVDTYKSRRFYNNSKWYDYG